MAKYSIKDLEHLTGIKAHTLRIWEKRYNLVQPERTETNIRYYSDDDLKKVLNVSLLYGAGTKISKIVALSQQELSEKVRALGNENLTESVQIESLVIAMVEIDEARFEKVLSNCTIRMGFEQTMIQVVYPFLRKVGVLWQSGAINPVQEHFISNLIRQKIIVAIDGVSRSLKPGYRTYLLFLPEGEWHEMGLLFRNYLIQKNGHKAIYIGQSAPLDDVAAVHKLRPADVVVTSSLSSMSIEQLNGTLSQVSDNFTDIPVHLISHLNTVDGLIDRSNLVLNQEICDFIESLKG